MQLTADQELRRELLLFSLSKQPDLNSAINIAAQMEQFVLRGCSGVEEAAGRVMAAVMGIEAAQPSERAEPGRPNALPTLHNCEVNGNAASLPRLNGTTSSARPVADAHDAGGGSKKRRWSNGDDERLRRLWHSNHSLEEIAEAMGRTTPSLYSRARALGMAKRSPVVDKREAARPARGGREPASPGAGLAPAGEDDPAGERGRQPGPVASESRRTEIEIKRHCMPPGSNGKSPARVGGVLGGGKEAKRSVSPAGHTFQAGPFETSVEPIIHFLRSRDYSVVRVEDGRFRLDGRRILSADELREKANQVRQSLGKPPFAMQPAGPAG